MLQKLHILHRLQLITVLLLIRDCYCYTSWSTSFISQKMCVKFPIFDSVSFLLSFIFCSTESMNSLTLKRHNHMNKNKNKINRKDTRILIFKLQLEVWQFNDICVSGNSLKIDQETHFLDLENWSLE